MIGDAPLAFLVALAFADGLGLRPDVLRLLAGAGNPLEHIMSKNRYVMANLLPQTIHHLFRALLRILLAARLRLLPGCSIGVGRWNCLGVRTDRRVVLHGCSPRTCLGSAIPSPLVDEMPVRFLGRRCPPARHSAGHSGQARGPLPRSYRQRSTSPPSHRPARAAAPSALAAKRQP